MGRDRTTSAFWRDAVANQYPRFWEAFSGDEAAFTDQRAFAELLAENVTAVAPGSKLLKQLQAKHGSWAKFALHVQDVQYFAFCHGYDVNKTEAEAAQERAIMAP